MSFIATGAPATACAWLARGSALPSCAYDHTMRPEQSNSDGPVAPHE